MWASLILVGGGVLLAVAGIITVRTAAKWPEIVARLAATEIVANEALEVATKARRLASAQRTRKRTSASPNPEPEPGSVPATTPNPNTPWFPGMMPGGARLGGAPPAPPRHPSQNGDVRPVGFADE